MPYMYSEMQNKMSKTRESPLESIGEVGMTSLQVNCSQAEVNASVFITVF